MSFGFLSGRLSFPTLAVVISILYATSYHIYRILPIVQMGERSWPLYFFLIDDLSLIGVIFLIVRISLNTQKSRYFLVQLVLLCLLLAFPVVSIYITYSDLTGVLCKESIRQKCIHYVHAADLRNIKFTWER
jgi:hypothetical protein